MPKIMVSLRSIVSKCSEDFAFAGLRAGSFKSIEYLKFSHFRHFVILGISAGSLIFN
jgi:hypothetical protein